MTLSERQYWEARAYFKVNNELVQKYLMETIKYFKLEKNVKVMEDYQKLVVTD